MICEVGNVLAQCYCDADVYDFWLCYDSFVNSHKITFSQNIHIKMEMNYNDSGLILLNKSSL